MKFHSLFETIIDDRKWKEYSFVMPTVSIGNVGQLTIDLLVASFQAKLVGYLTSDCVVPVVGLDAFDENSSNLTTSLDVFECPEKRLVFLQQRAPLVKSRQSRYVEEIANWIVEKDFMNVIIFTSMLACERLDSQLVGRQCRYVMSKTVGGSLNENEISSLIPKLERRQQVNGVYIPGGGIAEKLFEKIESKNKDVVILLRFSYEADNTFDAADLAMIGSSIFSWISAQDDKFKWKNPPSWKHLFGQEPDQIIYQ